MSPKLVEPTTSHKQTTSQKQKVGRVVSAKMDKTVVVAVDYLRPHPIYRKTVRKTNKFYAHDEGNRCQYGDVVRIEETRPLSKLKRWRVIEIVSSPREQTKTSYMPVRTVKEQPEKKSGSTREVTLNNTSPQSSVGQTSSAQVDLRKHQLLRRYVHASFEDGRPVSVLQPERWYTLKLYIGAPPSSSEQFIEPDFGGRDSVGLLIGFFSRDFAIEQPYEELELPRVGDTKTIGVRVQPLREGTCSLEIIVYLATQLQVLQRVRIMAQVVSELVLVS